jgi:hypothetical protein
MEEAPMEDRRELSEEWKLRDSRQFTQRLGGERREYANPSLKYSGWPLSFSLGL